jgi:uncharacterized protein YbjQ (UPF0145 family)
VHIKRSTKDMAWQCKKCGESHEDQFDSCWKCGIEREGNAVIRDFKIQEFQSFTDDLKLPCSTTPEIPGRKVNSCRGIVCGEAIMGANFLRDIAAGITNIVGGRSGAYENTLREGREIALQEMMDEAREIGGNAVIGVDIDYETVGANMLMVSASGTAVVLESLEVEPGPRG